MRRFPLFLAAGLVLLGCLLLWRSSSPGLSAFHHAHPRPLLVHCAASLKKPLEQTAAQFQSETGAEIQLQFGGTASLLSAIRTTRCGDLFVSADSAGIADGKRFGLLRDVVPFALQTPVIAVARGNPHQIATLQHLLSPQVRLALVNPETAAVGRLLRTLLGEAYAPLARKAVVTKPTVTEVAADLSLGSIDAAILWDSTLSLFPTLEAVPVPELASHSEPAYVSVLNSSSQPKEALRFAQFLAAPEKGGAILRRNGFRPIAGDRWAHPSHDLMDRKSFEHRSVETQLHRFCSSEPLWATVLLKSCNRVRAFQKKRVPCPKAKLVGWCRFTGDANP